MPFPHLKQEANVNILSSQVISFDEKKPVEKQVKTNKIDRQKSSNKLKI